MSGKTHAPSTALMRIDGRLSERETRVMYEWSALFSGASMHVKASGLADVKGTDSYLVVAAMTNRALGVLRGGVLDDAAHRPLPPNEPCVLYRAAKA